MHVLTEETKKLLNADDCAARRSVDRDVARAEHTRLLEEFRLKLIATHKGSRS